MAKTGSFNSPQNFRENRRVSVYYDSKPSNASETDKRICMVLKSSGQVIRFNENEAFDLMMEMTKALKWKANRYKRH